MHGLINRSIQSFVCDNYGDEIWSDVALRSGLEFIEFEAMLTYDDAVTPAVLNAMSEVLGRPRNELMEDIGTYLVSHPDFEPVRRLLRFGGVDFEDFLHSLDDLSDRARLAVADLDLPVIELRTESDGHFTLFCATPVAGYGCFMMGILRVMADDYGALVVLDHAGAGASVETVSIVLVEAEYAEGRAFDLGARVG